MRSPAGSRIGVFFRDVLMGADIFHIAVADQPRLVHHGAAVLKDHGDIMAAELAPLLVGQAQQIHAVVSDTAGGNPAPSGKESHGRAERLMLTFLTVRFLP